MAFRYCQIEENGLVYDKVLYTIDSEKLLVNFNNIIDEILFDSKNVSKILNEDYIEYYDKKKRLSIKIPIDDNLPIENVKAMKEVELSFTPHSIDVYKGIQPPKDIFKII